MATILDGKKAQKTKMTAMKAEIAKLSEKPTLVIIQIGEREESSAYIEKKKIFGASVGANVIHEKLPETISEIALISKIKIFNTQKNVHGIIVQLPIPASLNVEKITSAVLPEKDVDGLNIANQKLLEENKPGGFIPATAKGVMSLLDFYKIPIKGKKVTVIGRSALVGKPIALCFKNRGAIVTVCHRGTTDLAFDSKHADILIVAAGHPKLIDDRHVSAGQSVIDVGINAVSGEKLEEELPKRTLVGDVDFEKVEAIVGAISPVPGGVGPMTVLSLFENLLLAFDRIKA